MMINHYIIKTLLSFLASAFTEIILNYETFDNQ